MGCGGGCCGGGGCGDGSEEHGHDHGHAHEMEPAQKIEMPAGKIVNVTEMASSKVAEIMESEGKKGWGLRIEAIPGGCAGFLYNMEFEQNSREGDIIQEEKGFKVFIDPMSKDMLYGAEINFVDGLQGTGFTFKNPNAKSSCGCGKSFG